MPALSWLQDCTCDTHEQIDVKTRKQTAIANHLKVLIWNDFYYLDKKISGQKF